MRRGKVTKLWMRHPRVAWQNNGGPIPYRFRGRIKRTRDGVFLINGKARHRIGKNQWAVFVFTDGEGYVFTTAMINRFYGRMPPR